MRMVDLIQKKRDGGHLTRAELQFIIQGYTQGIIPDYQMSAWAMAVYFQGMNKEETAQLTLAMAQSGEEIDLASIHGLKVDKHSTGGVGDTTTLVLAPLVAACGVPVAKMSGRGLGHTGGTLDKLESFSGFSVEMSKEHFIQLINQQQVAIMGQSSNLTPADKLLYALRDVTATVDSIPLIASSIMSKKIASGADAIVLDVKVGSGAFMKTVEDATLLAQAMVDIGREIGRKTVAVLSNMDQPLGWAVGNTLEVKEAIETLKGQGPADLTELCLTLGAHMLCLGGQKESIQEARSLLQQKITSGEALLKLAELVEAQGGSREQVLQPASLPQAAYQVPVLAPNSGYVSAISAEEIGRLAMSLGAGRATKDDAIDLAVGLVLHQKVGDFVQAGEPLATLHMNSLQEQAGVEQRLLAAYTLAELAPEPIPLIYTEIMP